MSELKIGTTIKLSNGETATIKDELGRGGQGVVYLVKVSGQNMALKWYLKHPGTLFHKNLCNNVRAGSFVLPTTSSHSKLTGFDSLVKWLKKKNGKISIARVWALVSAIMAVVAIVGVIVCLVAGSPKIWEWLLTLGCSIFNVFIFALF